MHYFWLLQTLLVIPFCFTFSLVLMLCFKVHCKKPKSLFWVRQRHLMFLSLYSSVRGSRHQVGRAPKGFAVRVFERRSRGLRARLRDRGRPGEPGDQGVGHSKGETS